MKTIQLILLSLIFINSLGLDISWTQFVPSFVVKAILILLLIVPKLLTSKKVLSCSLKNILYTILTYISINIILGALIDPSRFTTFFLNSLLALALPAIILYRYPKLDWEQFLKIIKLTPLLILLIGLAMDLMQFHPLFRTEYDGSVRLQATSVPANFAMTVFFAVLAHSLDFNSFKTNKILFYFYLVLLIGLIILTGSRMALFCSMLVIAFIWYRRIRIPTLFKVFMIAVGLIFSTYYLIINSARSNQSIGSINTSGREEAWLFFFQEYQSNSNYGIGIGNSLKYFTAGDIQYFTTPHNEYLRLLLEGGNIAFISIGLLVLYFILNSFRAYRKFGDQNKYYLLVLYLTTLVYSITDNTFSTYQYYLPFLFFVYFLGKRNIKPRNAQFHSG